MCKEKVGTSPRSLRRSQIVIGLACALLVAAPRAKGQETGIDVYDEQLRVLLEEQTPVAREVGVEAGGWFSFAFFDYDDESARTERTLRQYELRAWGSVNVQGVHRAYIRGLTSYSDWNTSTSPTTHGDDFVEPKLEAFDLLVEYLFDCSTRPRVAAEYLFATGDDDRRRTTSATVGGNRPGTTDRAFNAFGFRDTGLSFSPRLSNLHIYALDASFLPLENIEPFKRMEIGSKVFFYHKADASGPISDTTADQPSRWVGWEWDLYCDWRVTSDLVWTTRYGVFRPGAAFKQSDSCRDFLYTGFLLSF